MSRCQNETFGSPWFFDFVCFSQRTEIIIFSDPCKKYLLLVLHFISPILVMPGRIFTAKALSCRKTQKAFDSKCRLTRTGSWKEGSKTWLGRETESCLSSPVPSPGRALSSLWALLSQSQLIPSLQIAGRGACEASALYIVVGEGTSQMK